MMERTETSEWGKSPTGQPADLGTGVRTLEGGDKTNPAHYDRFPKGMQPIDFIKAAGWIEGHAKACILKYIARAGTKPGESALDDYRKARFYLDCLIAGEEIRP
jgi:hypothetical protein